MEHSAGLRIYLLGGFRVIVGGQEIAASEWRRRKSAHLVKLLALAPDHRLHREQILDRLWPDMAPADAVNNLHRAVHIARHILQAEGSAATVRRYLARQGDTVLLDAMDAVWTDLAAFTSAATAARGGDDPVLCRQALALYTGELLPDDRYEDWAIARREEALAISFDLLWKLAELSESRGDIAGAIDALHRLTDAEPAHEAARAGLMRLYAVSGDRHQALRQYHQLRSSLRRELDTEPDPSVDALYRAILASRVTPRNARSPTATSRLTGPSSPPRTNLPYSLTSFVGREQEICETRQLLEATRLLTLTGAGGCGKTRLALEAAAGLTSAYRDGVWLVELASLTDPALISHLVAAAFGVREESQRPLIATLTDRLRGQQALLVLDNCEHLIAACAEFAETVLRACPDLRILTTSREALNVPGEIAWLVPSLPCPHPHQNVDLARLTDFAAIHLFVDRARLSQPDFSLTEQTAPAVIQICHRLDGIPLAIELAASQVRVLAVEQIAERLDDCLNLLIHGNRTALPRHQTLRQAITWSYDLLSEPERALFRQLAVFAGGFDLAAAEAIAPHDNDGVLARLTSLVDKSLVFPVPAEGPQRFRLLEPIRQYAMQRLLDARVAEQARDRHLVWCVQFAELAEPSLIGKDQRVWLDRLDLEHDNFRAALNWAMERGDMTSGLRLAGALARFWQVRGYVTEGRSFLNRLLSGGTTAASADRAKALFAAGLLTHWQSDLLGAEVLYRQSLELWREVGDNGRVALLLNQLGILAEEFGDYQQANELLEESLALRRAIGDEWGIASTLMILGNAANSQADYPRAIRFYEETVSLLRRVGDLRGVSLALGNLGCVANRQGKYRRAVDLNEESLALMREIGERFMMSEPLYNLGVAVAALGDTARAAALFTESLDIQRAHGDRWGSTVSLLLLARVAHAAGDDQRASALAIESLRLRVELGDNRRIPDCLEAIAEFATDLDRLPPATLLFSAAFRMREQLATPLPNSSQASVAAALCRIPALLGASMFADIWQHGQTLSREAAVEEAITLAQALATAERDSTYAHPSPTALGAREREIAALIAAGLTNRQIATQLGISPRTADTHVSHILRKLGLSSRAEIAAALHPTPPH